MVVFEVVVDGEFWDHKRRWPQGVRPVFSAALVMRNAGTLTVPAHAAADVEAMLRSHPHVRSVQRAPILLYVAPDRSRRRAA
jgi:hypothetical protein